MAKNFNKIASLVVVGVWDNMNEKTRRSILAGIGGTAVGSVALGGTVGARQGDSDDSEYPPEGITEWGESIALGEGAVSTFASTTPSGIPTAVGIHFAAGTFEGLPYAEDFENGDAEGIEIHGGFWTKPFNLGFPESAPEPFEYAGCGWNPQGHLPRGVYTKPHFDLHYYFYEPETIHSIGPGIIEDLPDEKTPEGYRLIEDGVIVPAMGAHLAPENAPEFDDTDDASVWEETLIWGAADVDGDGEYENNFVEPMVTLDYFQNRLEGVDRQSIAQPDVYPRDGHYPTTYTVRELGDGGYAVVLEDFVERSG